MYIYICIYIYIYIFIKYIHISIYINKYTCFKTLARKSLQFNCNHMFEISTPTCQNNWRKPCQHYWYQLFRKSVRRLCLLFS